MHRRWFLAGALASSATPAFASRNLTEASASSGVHDALALAAQNATTRLGRPNGFFGDMRVRIPLPGVLGQAQRNLRGIGLAAPLDRLQENLNHAAETTMPQAGRLFANAVRSLTVSDAIDIVRGPEDSATRYLSDRTEHPLTTALRPPMTQALTQSGAFNLMRGALHQIGMTTMTTDLRTQIIDFSTEKAIDGCFTIIGDEERSIRRNPLRRSTDILRQVFG